MNFHPFNQCWRWDKQSDLKMWLSDVRAWICTPSQLLRARVYQWRNSHKAD